MKAIRRCDMNYSSRISGLRVHLGRHALTSASPSKQGAKRLNSWQVLYCSQYVFGSFMESVGGRV